MINFAIIGCGHIAQKHAEAIHRATGAKLLAIFDKEEERTKPYQQKFGAKGYSRYEELLDDREVDIVCICTPSGTHPFLTIKAAEAKKHVIVEKPMALKVEDAEKMIRACEQNNVKLAVVHPNRFRPVMLELKKVMEEGRLGKISHVNAVVRWNRNQAYYEQAPWRGTKEHDGGVLMNQAIHNLDLLLWLVGDVKEVMSMSATRLRNIETEDVSTGVVTFSSGALGVVEAAVTIYPNNLEETISIFGENGTIKIGGPTASYIKHWNVASMDDQQTNELIERVKIDPFGKPGHQWIVEDMVQAILEEREPVVSGQDGLKALQFVESMYRSAEIGQKVKLEKELTHS
ncbi:Gfo/Idh/MocA family protein [Halalkalibacterium ligniniphilum]|uniref:Gfo/Idh/MocA family protein n=1 Tax=Halalkalibacterium ligniniphilum TaxID=1134413 RepID=UPI00034AC44F|nr:Gfo/Idh/MocA family oxidoreductase [Halalkalibacterium ligniniphilum]